MDVPGIQRQSTNGLKARIGSLWHWLKPKPISSESDGELLHLRNPAPHMVNWFDPKQLLGTAVEVLVSTTLGRHSDRRSIEASNREARFFDFSARQGAAPLQDHDQNIKPISFPLEDVTGTEQPTEFWIDYVSDLGDGFNSTYAVAYALAQESLDVEGVEEPLKRGNILIFGGDEVYPTAHRREYKERLVNIYHWAWKELPEQIEANGKKCLAALAPYLFALPGNHDWYDSLSSFMEFFGDHEKDEFASGWHVPQNRSYFAIKLPQGWWLLGVDFQLESDLDYWQIKYFEKIVNLYMKPGDRIILCCAEPFWVFEKLDPKHKSARLDSNLRRLIEILKVRRGETDNAEADTTPKDKQIVLYLAGDLHHYFRAWGKADKDDPKEKNTLQITSGGGGAFLHPTHGAMAWAYEKTDFRTHSYPSARRSWWMGWWNFLFPLFNLRFGLVTAGLYFLIGWFVFFSDLDEHRGVANIFTSQSLSTYGKVCLNMAFHSPPLSLLLLIAMGGFIFFTFTEHTARHFRLFAGFIHAAFQIGGAFLMLWFSNAIYEGHALPIIKQIHFHLNSTTPGRMAMPSLQWVIELLPFMPKLLIITALMLAGGWLIGSILMGLYLFISLNVFGQHQTGAFSSLKIEDWKNFLRLKINLETGELTIYPIGIRRVPRIWEPADGIALDPKQKPHYRPVDEKASSPELIEGPIIITTIEGHVDRMNVSLSGNTSRVKRSNQWQKRYQKIRLPFGKERPRKKP